MVGCPIFVAFPSNHIPKATKDFSVDFYIHIGNFCKFSQRIATKIFEATTYIIPRV